MNAFVLAAKENGTLDALNEKWFGSIEPTEKLDYDSLTGENGTLRIAVAPDLKPISYMKDGTLAGYEMELMLLFAREYGYKLDMSYMTFDAILPPDRNRSDLLPADMDALCAVGAGETPL